jgi:hypothetical protein
MKKILLLPRYFNFGSIMAQHYVLAADYKMDVVMDVKKLSIGTQN